MDRYSLAFVKEQFHAKYFLTSLFKCAVMKYSILIVMSRS